MLCLDRQYIPQHHTVNMPQGLRTVYTYTFTVCFICTVLCKVCDLRGVIGRCSFNVSSRSLRHSSRNANCSFHRLSPDRLSPKKAPIRRRFSCSKSVVGRVKFTGRHSSGVARNLRQGVRKVVLFDSDADCLIQVAVPVDPKVVSIFPSVSCVRYCSCSHAKGCRGTL